MWPLQGSKAARLPGQAPRLCTLEPPVLLLLRRLKESLYLEYWQLWSTGKSAKNAE